MNGIVSYLLVNTYSAFSPAVNAAAVCTVNGQTAACPEFLNIFGPLVTIVVWALILLVVVSMWKLYSKAGQPGWASIIPIYNVVVMLEIVRKPTWWVILCFLPFVNIIISFVIAYELAKVFGKDMGYALGLIVLPFIFYPMLGFGSAQYVQTANEPAPQM